MGAMRPRGLGLALLIALCFQTTAPVLCELACLLSARADSQAGGEGDCHDDGPSSTGSAAVVTNASGSCDHAPAERGLSSSRLPVNDGQDDLPFVNHTASQKRPALHSLVVHVSELPPGLAPGSTAPLRI